MDHPFLDLPLTFDNIYRMFVTESETLDQVVADWYRESKGQEPAISDIQHGTLRSFEAQQFLSRWGTMRRALQNTWPIVGPEPPPGTLPRGIVRTRGRMMLDDNGTKNFLVTTLMWSVWGAEFDFPRWDANLAYCQSFALDGIRTLGSVMGASWEGRKIDPTRPEYQNSLALMFDTAFSRGLRQFPFTMLGDHFTDVHKATDLMIEVMKGREEKIGCVEVANEWGHAVEISAADLVKIGKKVRAAFPEMLLALSRPRTGQVAEMQSLMAQVGGPMYFPRHLARQENDRNWRQARQPYDFQDDAESGHNQEPAGQASSVGELWKPRQRGCMRWLATVAGCGADCLHTGNGVRGKDDPAHGRQPNLMDIPEFADYVAAVRMVERWLPEGVQNWTVVNNGPSRNHPLSLPRDIGDGFWEGSDDIEKGDCNKNYAVLGPDGRFMVGLFGLNEGDARRSGQALYDMHVDAFDSLTGEQVESKNLAQGGWLTLPGRQDREMSHIIVGQRQ